MPVVADHDILVVMFGDQGGRPLIDGVGVSVDPAVPVCFVAVPVRVPVPVWVDTAVSVAVTVPVKGPRSRSRRSWFLTQLQLVFLLRSPSVLEDELVRQLELAFLLKVPFLFQ